MSPIYYKCDCNGGSAPKECLWIYQITTFLTGDPNWNLYKFISDITPITILPTSSNPPLGAVTPYTNIVGINGNSEIFGNIGLIQSQYAILSYYGTYDQSINYKFQAIDPNDNPATGYWQQATSCTERCYEHPFQKPDFAVFSIEMDSIGFIQLNFIPAPSLLTLDLSIPATVLDFEALLRTIYGTQVTVSTQLLPSGNIILRINQIYTDKITFNMVNGSQHIMTEVPCI